MSNFQGLFPTPAMVGKFGLSSPLCISTACHYLEAERFQPDATAAIASASPKRRLYCFERGGDVLAAFSWDDSDIRKQRLEAIALRNGDQALLENGEGPRVRAAAVFGLGIIQYRNRQAGGSGSLFANAYSLGVSAADLEALNFRWEEGVWRSELRTRTRIGARIALVRLRLSTRR